MSDIATLAQELTRPVDFFPGYTLDQPTGNAIAQYLDFFGGNYTSEQLASIGAITAYFIENFRSQLFNVRKGRREDPFRIYMREILDFTAVNTQKRTIALYTLLIANSINFNHYTDALLASEKLSEPLKRISSYRVIPINYSSINLQNSLSRSNELPKEISLGSSPYSIQQHFQVSSN